jgi:transposase
VRLRPRIVAAPVAKWLADGVGGRRTETRVEHVRESQSRNEQLALHRALGRIEITRVEAMNVRSVRLRQPAVCGRARDFVRFARPRTRIEVEPDAAH